MPKYSTRCNIADAEGHICGQEIVITAGIKAPEPGEPSDPKTKGFVQAIVAHLMKKHPAMAAANMNLMEQFLAYSVIGLTSAEDPNVLGFMARFAEFLCRMSAMPVSDDMILQLVAHMGMTMDDPQREKVIGAMTYLRNFQIRKIGAPEVEKVLVSR